MIFFVLRYAAHLFPVLSFIRRVLRTNDTMIVNFAIQQTTEDTTRSKGHLEEATIILGLNHNQYFDNMRLQAARQGATVTVHGGAIKCMLFNNSGMLSKVTATMRRTNGATSKCSMLPSDALVYIYFKWTMVMGVCDNFSFSDIFLEVHIQAAKEAFSFCACLIYY